MGGSGRAGKSSRVDVIDRLFSLLGKLHLQDLKKVLTVSSGGSTFLLKANVAFECYRILKVSKATQRWEDRSYLRLLGGKVGSFVQKLLEQLLLQKLVTARSREILGTHLKQISTE